MTRFMPPDEVLRILGVEDPGAFFAALAATAAIGLFIWLTGQFDQPVEPRPPDDTGWGF